MSTPFRRIRRSLLGLAVIASSIVAVPIAASVVNASDGTVDSSFGRKGAVILANSFGIAGMMQTTYYRFNPENSIIDSAGRIVLVGRAVNTEGGSPLAALMRFSQAGVPDTTFGQGGSGLVLVSRFGPSIGYDVVEVNGAYLVYSLDGNIDGRLGTPSGDQSVTRIGLDGLVDFNSWESVRPMRSASTRVIGFPVLADGSKFSILTKNNGFYSEGIWTEWTTSTGVANGPNGDRIYDPNFGNFAQPIAAAVTGESGTELFHIVSINFQNTKLYTYDPYQQTYGQAVNVVDLGALGLSSYTSSEVPLRLSDGGIVIPLSDNQPDPNSGATNSVGLVKITSAGALDTAFSTDGMLPVTDIYSKAYTGENPDYDAEFATEVDVAEVRGSSPGIAISGKAANGNAQLKIVGMDGTTTLAATELTSSNCQGATKTIVSNASGTLFGFGVNPAGKLVMVKFGTGGIAGSICGQAAVPDAPTITSVTAGNGQLSVAFTAPSSDGGEAINNYEVSTNGGTSFTALSPASTTSPIVITGLTNGTSYSVKLKAVNIVGAGAGSDPLSGAPVAPSVPSSSSTSSTSVPSSSSTTSTSVPSSSSTSSTSVPSSSSTSSTSSTSVPSSSSTSSTSVPSSSSTTPSTTPSTTSPSSSTPAPTLVTSSNAATLVRTPGSESIIVNGTEVSIATNVVDIPAARTPEAQRTPTQVAAIQQAGAALLQQFLASLPAGATSNVVLVNTATGAVMQNLVFDANGNSVNVPVEDIVFLDGPQLSLMIGSNNANITADGKYQVGAGGIVGVTGSGLGVSASGEIIAMSTPTLLANFQTTAAGDFNQSATLPSSIGVGDHTLVVASGSTYAMMGIRVVPSALPTTGATTDRVVIIALFTLVFGALFFRGRRTFAL